MTKRVLLVCMLDSIHSANWIQRFRDWDVSIEVYPSQKFRHVHPKIVELLKQSSNIRLVGRNRLMPLFILGYKDFFINEFFSKLCGRNTRLEILQSHLDKSAFHFVHALEIQAAGYLSAKLSLRSGTQLIVTNWGSDIYYFKDLAADAALIRNLLQKTHRYSAECVRDYDLARNMGFTGLELPVIPNSGGNSNISTNGTFQKEMLIVVKCYGGRFGRGDLAIKAVSRLLQSGSEFRIFFYSVSNEYEKEIVALQRMFPGHIDFSTIRRGKSHPELMDLFNRARIYLGCSISDGISTSFLEALSHGVYPIQTDTSCANEWVEKGIHASLVSLDVDQISTELLSRAANWQGLEKLTSHNFEVASVLLDPANIQAKSRTFYHL
jgi:glycosyltransferase involved in cell wall biosynthesis